MSTSMTATRAPVEIIGSAEASMARRVTPLALATLTPPGASWRHSSNGGSDWTGNCSDDISISGSVWIRYSTKCKFYTDTNCRGTSKSGGLNHCVAGAFKSFACVRSCKILCLPQSGLFLMSLEVLPLTRPYFTTQVGSFLDTVEYPVTPSCLRRLDTWSLSKLDCREIGSGVTTVSLLDDLSRE